jgi:hypothetical protein
VGQLHMNKGMILELKKCDKIITTFVLLGKRFIGEGF